MNRRGFFKRLTQSAALAAASIYAPGLLRVDEDLEAAFGGAAGGGKTNIFCDEVVLQAGLREEFAEVFEQLRRFREEHGELLFEEFPDDPDYPYVYLGSEEAAREWKKAVE